VGRGIKRDFRPPIALSLLHTRHSSSLSPRFIVKAVLGLVDNEWISLQFGMPSAICVAILCGSPHVTSVNMSMPSRYFRGETLRWRRMHFGHSPESRKHFGPSFRMGSFGDCPLIISMRPCYNGQSGLRKGRENDCIQQSSANVWYDFSSRLGHGSSEVVE
jgi:hypothetical protein